MADHAVLAAVAVGTNETQILDLTGDQWRKNKLNKRSKWIYGECEMAKNYLGAHKWGHHVSVGWGELAILNKLMMKDFSKKYFGGEKLNEGREQVMQVSREASVVMPYALHGNRGVWSGCWGAEKRDP